MCEQAKKRVEWNNTVQKLAPLCASSSPVSSSFLDMLHSGPHWAADWPGSTCFFLFFLIFPVFLLLIIGHGARLYLSHLPQGLWLMGMLWGIRQMSGQNSRRRLRMHSLLLFVALVIFVKSNFMFWFCLFLSNLDKRETPPPWLERPWEGTEEI